MADLIREACRGLAWFHVTGDPVFDGVEDQQVAGVVRVQSVGQQVLATGGCLFERAVVVYEVEFISWARSRNARDTSCIEYL